MDNFKHVLKRLYQSTEIKSQRQLADVLKIRPPSITDAKKRGVVPPDWVVKLSLYYNLNPAWLLSGKGPVYIELQPSDSSGDDHIIALEPAMTSKVCRHESHCSKIEKMPMGQELLSDFFGLVNVRIPLISATYSTRSRPPIPEDLGQFVGAKRRC